MCTCCGKTRYRRKRLFVHTHTHTQKKEDEESNTLCNRCSKLGRDARTRPKSVSEIFDNIMRCKLCRCVARARAHASPSFVACGRHVRVHAIWKVARMICMLCMPLHVYVVVCGAPNAFPLQLPGRCCHL